jgi:hypothetical protein
LKVYDNHGNMSGREQDMAVELDLVKQATELVINATRRVAGRSRNISLDTLLDDLGLSAADLADLYAAILDAISPVAGMKKLTPKRFDQVKTVGDIVKAVTSTRPRRPGLGIKVDPVFPKIIIGEDTVGGDKQEIHPTTSSGTIRPLYGVVIRDKSRSADVDTLMAYKTVALDLMKDHKGPDAKNLADAVKELDKAIAAKPATTDVVAAPSIAPKPLPETERQISIWIGEGDKSFDRVLQIGKTYLLNCKVGAPVEGSLTSGPGAEIHSADIPAGGLAVEWRVIADGAELAAVTPDTRVSVATINGGQSWRAQFDLLIPETGDSAVPQLRVKPLKASPRIDVVITARGEIYRQFKILLAVSDRPAGRLATPARVADELLLAPAAQIGLASTHEWTTPDTVLNIAVVGSQAAVKGYTRSRDVDTVLPWVGVQAQVSGPIKNVRDAAEALRAVWEKHFDDIDPADLADRLSRWGKGYGGPDRDWSALGNYADAAHAQTWSRMASSAELRTLAQQGRRLFQAFFPGASELQGLLTELKPGARLNISWTPLAGAGFIPHVPWGLMYLADVPPAGQPLDPMAFLGLRCRIAYTSHQVQTPLRSLGALDATHRAHFLYWGDAANDVTGREARWQRSQWSSWKNQIFVPSAVQDAKAELLALLNNPTPAPTSLLYLFCKCSADAGNAPVLRFGDTNDPANMLSQTDFGTTALADRPLVFANACTSAAADPYMANDLEENFFQRECRAFLGTETKVPIVLASRFAAVFFHFFYRLLDPAPMAAGEAVAQARLFLWTHYRNIGGLFYCYVNQFDLFLARYEEIIALRK